MSIAFFFILFLPPTIQTTHSKLNTHYCRLYVNGDTSLLNLGAEERDPRLQTTRQMNLRMTWLWVRRFWCWTLVMRRTASSWGMRLHRLTSAKVNNWVGSFFISCHKSKSSFPVLSHLTCYKCYTNRYFYICRELQASSAHFTICKTKSSTQFFLHS